MVTFPIYQFSNIYHKKLKKKIWGYPPFSPFKIKTSQKGPRAYNSVYGLKIPKYRLNTDPNLKKVQTVTTVYSLYLTKIQT